MIRRLAAVSALCFAAATVFAQAEGIPTGRWEGTVDIGSGGEPIAIRLLEKGALVDLPLRRMFGYPVPAYWRESARVIFSIPGESGDFVFDASPVAPGADGRAVIGGSCSGANGFESRFTLRYEPATGRGERFEVATARGVLPGTLLMPRGGGGDLAVALLVAAEGPIDRDGNNYAVPGRSDSLKALAEALADLGVASLRFDKRGAGESYALVSGEEFLVYSDHVEDAADALRELASDGRFARIVVVGHGEGGLVAAAALAALRSGLAAKGADRDLRLVLLGTPADSPLEAAEKMIAGLAAGKRDEGRRIVASLRSGRIFPKPSPFFAEYFRLENQPYLISSYRYDLATELRKADCRLLYVRGTKDAAATASDARRIAAMRSDARFALVEGMGRALKSLGDDPEDGYRSFVDPLMPLAGGLAESVAAFASEGLSNRGYR